jgi:hypothetical protein
MSNAISIRFWSLVSTRFSLLLFAEPIEVVRTCKASTFCICSIGAGNVKLMPEPTVREYLPNRVTTPSSCWSRRWMLVHKIQIARKPRPMIGHQLLPLARGGRPPNPPPLPPPRRKISSSEGPRVRPVDAPCGSQGLDGFAPSSPADAAGLEGLPPPALTPDPLLSPDPGRSHGPLLSLCDACGAPPSSFCIMANI